MARAKKSEVANDDRYSSKRKAMAEVSREQSAAGRDIGELPAVVDRDRKDACQDSFRLFCELYFPHRFNLSWSNDHLRAIEKLQSCILDGGLFAYAMPRGTGKTTLAEVAALWAVLYGHRSYVIAVGATQEMANNIVETIKNETESNELLIEDFPEVCYPIQKLEGINQRTGGQTYNGERTRMDLSNGLIVFPTIAGSKASGACIEAKGMTGSLRGPKRALAGGKQHRPDLAILDDPQTDESANSPTGNRKLERLINGPILGWAGPRKKIAAVMPCTVIAPDDMVDRILDTEKNPQWNGERAKMLPRLPDNLELWDQYAEVRRNSFREHGDNRDGNAFYAAHRSEMDNGAKVSWAERFNPDDLSAIQFAMNWRIDRPESFASECQNEPLRLGGAYGLKEFDGFSVASRINGLERRVVPAGSTRLTAFVDVGGELLWYAVCAWNEHFGGSVIDYGTYPQQNRSMFAKADARPSLSTLFPNQTSSQRVYSALTNLLPDLCGREYPGQNGGGLRIERCLVDSGWGETVDAVYRSISRYTLPIFPSKGVGRSTTSVGVARWKARPGERTGFHWRLTLGEGKRGRSVQFDPDAWKSFIHNAMTVPPGGNAGLMLFGTRSGQHDLLGEHFAAEYSEPATTKGDTYDKWSLRPDRTDNDWLDCIVGCAVAASVAGVTINSTGNVEIIDRPRVLTQSEIDEQIKNRKTIRPGRIKG